MHRPFEFRPDYRQLRVSYAHTVPRWDNFPGGHMPLRGPTRGHLEIWFAFRSDPGQIPPSG